MLCTGYLYNVLYWAVLSQLYLHQNWAVYLVQKRTATSRRPVPVVTEDSSESSEEEEDEEDVDDSDVDADFQLDRRQLEVEKV